MTSKAGYGFLRSEEIAAALADGASYSITLSDELIARIGFCNVVYIYNASTQPLTLTLNDDADKVLPIAPSNVFIATETRFTSIKITNVDGTDATDAAIRVVIQKSVTRLDELELRGVL